MKVLLLKDVYKLGRAGDVKKVADGFGRNFLIPQGLAVLATASALKQVESIREKAATNRAAMNQELSGIAQKLDKLIIIFPAKAGETGKLYGSITPQMVVDAIKEKSGYQVDRRQLELQPIRTLGDHIAKIRLTLDLIPEIRVIVHREGKAVELSVEDTESEEPAVPEAEAETAES